MVDILNPAFSLVLNLLGLGLIMFFWGYDKFQKLIGKMYLGLGVLFIFLTLITAINYGILKIF